MDELTEAMIRWQDTFEDHNREEMARYKEIIDEVKASRKLSISRSAALDVKIEEIANLLKQHAEEDRKRHELLEGQVNSAIPDKDFVEHGRMYLQRKTDIKEKQEISLETKKKVISGVAWGSIVLFGYAILEYIKIWIHRA
jgi:hypothetical protein